MRFSFRIKNMPEFTFGIHNVVDVIASSNHSVSLFPKRLLDHYVTIHYRIQLQVLESFLNSMTGLHFIKRLYF